MNLNPDDKIETIEVILTEDNYPIAYKNKLDELMEQEVFPSRKEAIRWLSKTPITLELYYEKHSGLFAVESGALEATPESIRSPYSGEPFTEKEEQNEAAMNGIQLLSALRKLDRNKKHALKEIRTYMQQTPCEYLNLLQDDNQKLNCKVRTYMGSRYPVQKIIEGIRLLPNGTLRLYTTEGEDCTDNQVLKEDLLRLHEAFEAVTRRYTPQEFCDLVNSCKDFPVALHDIIDRHGWHDYAAQYDNHIAYDPTTRTLITWNGGMPFGKAVCIKVDKPDDEGKNKTP